MRGLYLERWRYSGSLDVAQFDVQTLRLHLFIGYR